MFREPWMQQAADLDQQFPQPQTLVENCVLKFAKQLPTTWQKISHFVNKFTMKATTNYFVL